MCLACTPSNGREDFFSNTPEDAASFERHAERHTDDDRPTLAEIQRDEYDTERYGIEEDEDA